MNTYTHAPTHMHMCVYLCKCVYTNTQWHILSLYWNYMQVMKYEVLYKTKNSEYLAAVSDPETKSSICPFTPHILTFSKIRLLLKIYTGHLNSQLILSQHQTHIDIKKSHTIKHHNIVASSRDSRRKPPEFDIYVCFLLFAWHLKSYLNSPVSFFIGNTKT